MLSVAHAATGAFIANYIAHAPLAIILILTSHYLEDMVHHWDAGTGLGRGLKSRGSALTHELVDLALTVLVVLTLFPLPEGVFAAPLELLKLPQVWGAFAALLPDFLEAPRNFLKWEPAWLKPVSRFHKSFHRSTPDVYAGLAPQVLLLTILFLLK